VVFDTVGGETLRRSYGIVKRGGYLVSIVDDLDSKALAERGIRGSHAIVRADGAQLAQIARLIDEGKVTPRVSEIFDLKSAAAAQDLSQKGHTRGKIVLRIP
jgi:NADPH:quinone reductase-like Zn-dependent oxidoreductase